MSARTPGTLGRMPADLHVPDAGDLAEYGAAACLAALREEFAESVKQYPQYRGWLEGTTLGVARQRIGDEGFVRAEPGDLLLVKRDRSTWHVSMTRSDVAYVPGWPAAGSSRSASPAWTTSRPPPDRGTARRWPGRSPWPAPCFQHPVDHGC